MCVGNNFSGENPVQAQNAWICSALHVAHDDKADEQVNSLMHSTDIDTLSACEIPAAARILAQGMRDNPLHAAVFGTNAARVEPLLYAGFCRVLRQQLHSSRVLCVHQSRRLVAVAGMFAPGHCLPDLRDKLTLLPPLLRAGALHRLLRIRTWMRVWARHDPTFAHWHLGPAAVARSQQGRGHGGRLLQAICAHLDTHRACGYLETDKQANVRLYRRFGFRVIATEQVLGVTHWFMLRPAACGQYKSAVAPEPSDGKRSIARPGYLTNP